jgi:hypothetical protein
VYVAYSGDITFTWNELLCVVAREISMMTMPFLTFNLEYYFWFSVLIGLKVVSVFGYMKYSISGYGIAWWL